MWAIGGLSSVVTTIGTAIGGVAAAAAVAILLSVPDYCLVHSFAPYCTVSGFQYGGPRGSFLERDSFVNLN